MSEKAEKIKSHLRKHRTIYLAGVAGMAGFGAGALICGTDLIQVIDSFKVQWKSPTINEINTILVRRGHPGNKVICIETGEEVASQNRMAHLHGISASDLSKHLQGKQPHVKNKHYKITGEAQPAQTSQE